MNSDYDDYINSYQRWVESVATEHAIDNVDYVVACMMIEAGEAGDVWKKHLQGKLTEQEAKEKMKAELGDTLWYLSRLSTMYGIELSEIMTHNIDKLERRRDGR